MSNARRVALIILLLYAAKIGAAGDKIEPQGEDGKGIAVLYHGPTSGSWVGGVKRGVSPLDLGLNLGSSGCGANTGDLLIAQPGKSVSGRLDFQWSDDEKVEWSDALEGTPSDLGVQIWLVRNDPDQARIDARDALSMAFEIFDKNGTGVRFSWQESTVTDIHDNVTLEGCDVNMCECIRKIIIHNSNVFVHDEINIYYIPKFGFEASGGECSKFAIVEAGAPEDTMAHEIGHLFGLKKLVAAGKKNLMYQDAGILRDELTVGQVFWINVDKDSLFSRLRTPLIDVRDCDATLSGNCVGWANSNCPAQSEGPE